MGQREFWWPIIVCVAIFGALATVGTVTGINNRGTSDGLATLIDFSGRKYDVAEWSHWEVGLSPFQFRTKDDDVVTIRGDYVFKHHSVDPRQTLRRFDEPAPPPYIPRDGELVPDVWVYPEESK